MSEDAGQRMDRMYRVQRHIYDVTRRHYLLGRSTLINGLVPPDGGRVLEVGCGTGWNLLQAARMYPAAEFYGLDVSTVMLVTARAKIAKAGLHNRVTVAVGDATQSPGVAPFDVHSYDRIFASYVLSMIPDWTAVLTRAIAQLAPGGSLHIVDFGPAEGLPAPFRVGLHAWLANFDVTPRTTLAAEVERVAQRERMAPFYTELYRGYAQYAVLSRH